VTQVHVWLLRDPLSSDALLANRASILSAEELAMLQSLPLASSRVEFLAGRLLLRSMLAQRLQVSADALRFERSASGRPRLTGSVGAQVHFSLSHTSGLVACAVSYDGTPLGVDVENAARGRDKLEFAQRHFGESELAALRAASEGQRARQFVRLWALKESYVKARELGLAGLSLADFELKQLPWATARFAHGSADCAEKWRFLSVSVFDTFELALSARTGGAPLQCSVRQATANSLAESGASSPFGTFATA